MFILANDSNLFYTFEDTQGHWKLYNLKKDNNTWVQSYIEDLGDGQLYLSVLDEKKFIVGKMNSTFLTIYTYNSENDSWDSNIMQLKKTKTDPIDGDTYEVSLSYYIFGAKKINY